MRVTLTPVIVVVNKQAADDYYRRPLVVVVTRSRLLNPMVKRDCAIAIRIVFHTEVTRKKRTTNKQKNHSSIDRSFD